MENELLKPYIGKSIKDFKQTREVLVLNFEDKDKLELYAVGDCCSQSWFEDGSGLEALNPGANLFDIDLVLLSEVEEGDWECTKIYSVKIKTDKGYADIEMRNSSNGYYGGSISINCNDQYSNDKIYPNW